MRTALFLVASAFSVGTALFACSSSSTSTPAPATGDAGAAGDAAVTDLDAARASCTFGPGALAADTLGKAGADAQQMPIDHIVIVMRENRSFDQYFGSLPKAGQPDVETWPADYTNPDTTGAAVAPSHLTSTCYPADPPHQWDGMHAQWDNGKMDGFVKSAATVAPTDGHYAMGYFDQTDLPFYYFLANTYAVADHYHASALSGTFANRDYLLLASSYGIKNTLVDGFPPATAKTVFDALDEKNVSWGVFTPSYALEGTLGWDAKHKGVSDISVFFSKIKDGTLPAVSFIDSQENVDDEHPPADIQKGEAWTRAAYEALSTSSLWARSVMFLTWDESGGQFDHVPPPKACVASPDQSDFSTLGIRVPLIVLSPYAKPHFVSHEVHEHTSILRFIEARFGLGALTARDANNDALLDMFDFTNPGLATPPASPDAGTGGCK